jgi:carbamoyltransferase
MDCKKREWFRPTAPIALERNLNRLINNAPQPQLLHYMLADCMPSDIGVEQLLGVVHTNGTVRMQTIPYKAFNPFLFDVLDCLETEYGILALINTSFNGPGEPIVHTAQEAHTAACKMSLNAIVINGKLQILSAWNGN